MNWLRNNGDTIAALYVLMLVFAFVYNFLTVGYAPW